jgi:hypothetical protein
MESRPVKRSVRAIVVGGVVTATLAVACGGAEESAPPACPEGSTPREVVNEIAGPGTTSREDAVRAALQNLGMEATDDAIAAGVIASSPGGSPGTEEVEIQTSEGSPFTMTLAPLDPGWTVERSSWCAPNPG